MARQSKPKTTKERVRAELAIAPAPSSEPSTMIDVSVVDQILAIQLLVAWAGEANTDPPRFGWWRTSLVDEFGGIDLFKRLAPRTWKWAVLETARTAARCVDAEIRSNAADGDELISLFHFGFAVDEQLDDRLAELKRTMPDPVEAIPDLESISASWDPVALRQRLKALADVSIASSSVGSRIKGEMPADLALAARMLAAAMSTSADRYPAPHFKVGG